jgi:hypothetical protein
VNNPVNTEAATSVHKLPVVNTKPEPEIDPDVDEEDAAEKRKAYRREWMRKKREAGSQR